jgi:hypothetical protein
LWDSHSGQTIREWRVLAGTHQHPRAIAFKQNGSQVALLSFEEPVRVFNVNDGQLAAVS